MLAFLIACVVALAVLGLGFYAVLKMKLDAFRLKTSLWRVFTFSMEIESSGAAGRLADGRGRGQDLPGSGPDEAVGEQLAQPHAASGE